MVSGRRPFHPEGKQSVALEYYVNAMASLSEDKVISLWRDKNFPGHGLGLISFKQELESRYKVKLSDRYVKDCLVKIPEYLQNQLRRRKFERRHYFVHGFAVLYQCDIASMPKFGDFQYFFLLIDVYTSFLWTAPLTSKNNVEVGKAFDNIFKKWPVCDRLETDEGGEFLRLNSIGYFKEKKIFWHPKKPPHKASYAENAIFQIKRKLYLEMRRSESENWPDLLPQMTLNFNSRKHPSLGGLRPIDLNSKEKSVKLDEYVQKQEPNFRDFEKSQSDFQASSKIKVGSYVYVYKPYKRRKQRGFDIQVSDFSRKDESLVETASGRMKLRLLCRSRIKTYSS